MRRADRCFRYGDPRALRPGDVEALITEVRELHAVRRSLAVLLHEAEDRAVVAELTVAAAQRRVDLALGELAVTRPDLAAIQ